jgi:outer membrane PBP1 activator LpoA protein
MAQEREETTMSGQLLSCTQSLRWLLPVVMASALLGCGTFEGARLPPSAEYPADAKIALLLPPMAPERGTSQFVSDAAKAISAGFEAARKKDTAPPRMPTLVNTANRKQPLGEVVGTGSGYTLVVGPLLKANVDAALASRQGATRPPMLALNKSDAAAPGVFQFALAPEDEASTVGRLVARVHADAKSIGGPAVVYDPTDTWAERLKDAYLAAVRATTPAPEPTKIEYRRGNTAGLESDPRIAQAGTLFMIARPDEATGVVTALKANLARSSSRTPIIATSHITDDEAKSTATKGVFYVDVPWLVGSDAKDQLVEGLSVKPAYQGGELGRLYAMGIDAYYLGGQIAQDSAAPTLPEGMTGGLSFRGRNSQRMLALGRFGPNDNKQTRSSEEELLEAALSKKPIKGAASDPAAPDNVQ